MGAVKKQELPERWIRIGAKVGRHPRQIFFQRAVDAASQGWFQAILETMEYLESPAEVAG